MYTAKITFEGAFLYVIGSSAIISDHFNRENGDSRVGPEDGLRAGNNRERWKSIHSARGEKRGGLFRSRDRLSRRTKERSRFNASNVGRDKLSKHFSRYYQAPCAWTYRVFSAAFPQEPLSSFLLFFFVSLFLSLCDFFFP